MVVGGRREEFMRKRLEKDEILIRKWAPFPPKERDQRWGERERVEALCLLVLVFSCLGFCLRKGGVEEKQ